MKDKTLSCIQCNGIFTVTVNEQKRLLDRGFNLPRRCPECRRKKSKAHESDERWKDKGKRRELRRREDDDYDET